MQFCVNEEHFFEIEEIVYQPWPLIQFNDLVSTFTLKPLN
jgi:hypothetical protein